MQAGYILCTQGEKRKAIQNNALLVCQLVLPVRLIWFVFLSLAIHLLYLYVTCVTITGSEAHNHLDWDFCGFLLFIYYVKAAFSRHLAEQDHYFWFCGITHFCLLIKYQRSLGMIFVLVFFSLVASSCCKYHVYLFV